MVRARRLAAVHAEQPDLGDALRARYRAVSGPPPARPGGPRQAEDFSPEDLAAAIARKLVTLGASIPAAPGPLIGYAGAATGRSTGEMTVRIIDESGQPVAGAQVLAAAPNGTYVNAIADDRGAATLRLPARRLVTSTLPTQQRPLHSSRDHTRRGRPRREPAPPRRSRQRDLRGGDRPHPGIDGAAQPDSRQRGLHDRDRA